MKISYLTFLHCMKGSHDVFHENKLPYICSMYDTGFKVLSMKINYLAPFKHKHKYQSLAHENYLPRIPLLHGPWKLATWPFSIAWNRNHGVFHANKLPYICAMYDTVSKYIHENKLPCTIPNISISIRSCPWKLATSHSFIAWNGSHDVFHENKLPYICSMYDRGFKVVSMKINYLAHSNISINIRSLPMKISYLAFVCCMVHEN